LELNKKVAGEGVSHCDMQNVFLRVYTAEISEDRLRLTAGAWVPKHRKKKEYALVCRTAGDNAMTPL